MRQIEGRVLTVIAKLDEIQRLESEVYPEVSLPSSLERFKQEFMDLYSELSTRNQSK